MDGKSHFIDDAHLISPGIEREGVCIEINGSKIVAIHESREAPKGGQRFDAAGRRVLPGFIDIHTHGACGHDLCDAKSDSLSEMAKAKLREGVTTFFPTTLTLEHDSIAQALKTAAPYMRNPTAAKAPFIHIEGPFINAKCVGAQNPAFVRAPSIDEIDSWAQIAPIKIVSYAPESEDGVNFTGELTDRDLIPSLAHTAATYSHFQKAKDHGLKHLTHFCNQMTPLHHREIGLVGAGLLDDEVMIEMICDGIHLCPEMIQLVFKVVGPKRIMLITDSVAAAGMPDGEYQLGGLEIVVAEGAARLTSGALAGSTLAYAEGLKNVYKITGLPLGEIVATTSENQALSVGLEGLGRIEPGYWADLVVLNERFEPEAVFVDGTERLAASQL